MLTREVASRGKPFARRRINHCAMARSEARRAMMCCEYEARVNSRTPGFRIEQPFLTTKCDRLEMHTTNAEDLISSPIGQTTTRSHQCRSTAGPRRQPDARAEQGGDRGGRSTPCRRNPHRVHRHVRRRKASLLLALSAKSKCQPCPCTTIGCVPSPQGCRDKCRSCADFLEPNKTMLALRDEFLLTPVSKCRVSQTARASALTANKLRSNPLP